ncbi:MAG: hypothetical protein AAGL69_05075 [Pseudomonadota bacterium]
MDDVMASPGLSSAVRCVFCGLNLALIVHPLHAELPASFWGEMEAGVTGRSIHVRADTPLHSLLHEACHAACAADGPFVCDAGGCDDEESAVCAMQLILAEALPGVGSTRLARDMDRWGYSFREGSAIDFLHGDGREALTWLATSRPAIWSVVARLSGMSLS